MSLIDAVTQRFFVCETEKHCDCNCISFETEFVRSLAGAFLSSVRLKNTVTVTVYPFKLSSLVQWPVLFFRL